MLRAKRVGVPVQNNQQKFVAEIVSPVNDGLGCMQCIRISTTYTKMNTSVSDLCHYLSMKTPLNEKIHFFKTFDFA